jgi:hypothetical protein
MATVTAAITLTSAVGDLLTDALALSDSTAVTALHTSGLARTKISATAAGASASTIYTADDYAAPCYMYVKNTQTTSSHYIYIYNDTTSGDPVEFKLAGGDWAFFPTNADKTLRAYGSSANHVIEWMVFGTEN